jgi:nucleotide-binding universal stress UspA family protein
LKCDGAREAPVYDTILFPTDGSEGAQAALDHAVDLADRHDATLDVLHAGVEGDGESVASESALAVADAAGVAVNVVSLSGEPRQVIVDHVEDRDVDAVVMGTHGRRGLERYVLGSVTEKVLRTVDVPVLVVPLAAGER